MSQSMPAPGNVMGSLFNAIRTIRKIASASLIEDLTFQQYRVLSQVHQGFGQTQMAQNFQVSMAAISKIVDPLVKMGLLTRETGEDRRCLKLTLTKEGERIRKIIRGKVEKELEKSMKKLTSRDQKELEQGLVALDKLIGLMNEK